MKVLESGLRTFIGTHPDLQLEDLNIDRAQVSEVCEHDISTTFWSLQVPVSCPIRNVAIRVLCAKPSSIGVERLWSAFGNSLTAQRRSVDNGKLCKLIYVKMNAYMVPNDMLPDQHPKLTKYVRHMSDEQEGDLLSFTEDADLQNVIDTETAMQLAGAVTVEDIENDNEDSDVQSGGSSSSGNRWG